MKISDDSLRFLSELFIGDNFDVYKYKSGPQIIRFFNKYFEFHDTYSFGSSQPSRWRIAMERIVALWNKKSFNLFLTKILSVQYLQEEYPELAFDELSEKSQKAIELLNQKFSSDGYKIVKNGNEFLLFQINHDEEVLGEGGFSTCYYIKSTGLVEKRLKPAFYSNSGAVSRFKREFEITKSLNDLDGVVKVFSYDGIKLSYTMEKGECDLWSYVSQNVLDDESKRKIIYQIVMIMQKVHDRNILHRDLSPKNIFLFSGLFKIGDFGLGKNLQLLYSHQTDLTNSLGQYQYCDPRQLEKLKNGDKQSDIYSIGRIINFVFTNNPENCEHRYKSVVMSATNPNLKYRYSSVDELLNGLKNVDEFITKEEYEQNFILKLRRHENLLEKDISYICNFNVYELFDMIESIDFRIAYVNLAERGKISEADFVLQLDKIYEYVVNNSFLGWKNYDRLGYLGATILRSDCGFRIKELALDLLNIPISYNRYDIIGMVKREIIGQIDPILESRLAKNLFN